jgi:hypothetical protein
MKIMAIRDADPVDDVNLPDLETAIACLSVLGVVDSHASLFNNISGLCLILILLGGITLKSKTMNQSLHQSFTKLKKDTFSAYSTSPFILFDVKRTS